MQADEHDVRAPQAVRLFDKPPLRAAFTTGGVERPPRPANDRVIAVGVPERRTVGVEHLPFGERRDRLEGVRVFTDVVPRENATVRDRVVGNETVQVEVREARTVAVPLIRAPREILEKTELEVHARIERPLGSTEAPAFPVGLPFADGCDVAVSRDVPPRAVVVPALADRDDFSNLSAADDLANTVL